MKKKTMGERIAQARSDNGWLQSTLAKYAGVSTACIGMIERGERANPGIESVSAIAHALGMRIEDLYPHPKQKRRNK